MLNATINNGSVAQLNRALDYGSRGYRFESCRNHIEDILTVSSFFCVRVQRQRGGLTPVHNQPLPHPNYSLTPNPSPSGEGSEHC